MIKYFSQMRRKAQEPETPPPPPPTSDVPEEAPKEEDPTAELEVEDEGTQQTSQSENSGKDAVKFKLWAEEEAKKAGYTVEVLPSTSGKAVKIILDDSTDIITQKDAIKLAVALDENTMDWHLMDDPIVKGGGTWMIKLSKSESKK